MSTDAPGEGSAVSLPSGGGAVGGLGEKFSPDLFTGTGNFAVPIELPAGRLGAQPQLALAYSTGTGNGVFGLGWTLGMPAVTRKTSHGVPRYTDGDTFILSGAEDLVVVAGAGPGRVRYRPRTEGTFARIEHVDDATGDYWEIRGKDGMLTRYGTPRPANANTGWRDPATVAGGPGRVFAWKITETVDPFGNLVRYTYGRDRGDEPGHRWDQPLVDRIEYADYGDPAAPSFLVRVSVEYEPRPDPFSDHRAGFEIRGSVRCRAIRVSTHAADGVDRPLREYRFGYEQAPFNGVSLLTRVDVVGLDNEASPPSEHLPPLTFGYTTFDPARRRFRPLTGPGLPVNALGDPTMALVDLHGNGLPDIVDLGAGQRYWSNRGDGRFDRARAMSEAPPVRLGRAGVQLIDADGDGRTDLLVADGQQAGYFPMTFSDGWSRRSFQPYRQIPSTGLDGDGVQLVDLDGDGLTDVLRSGSRMQCWFNDADPRRAWARTAVVSGPVAEVDLSDPHVRLADMTGDGLLDVVALRNGNIGYWPNLGHGRFGQRVQMRDAPRLPDGFDARRLLLGDVDGDGVADLIYVDSGRLLLWGNRTGNGWTPRPLVVNGTPDVVDTDTIRLADVNGTGMAGLLYSRATDRSGQTSLRFLDFTGGHKPYLLDTVDNHFGARTTIRYLPSTSFFLRDQEVLATRWRTTLPFPVHVVAGVEVRDLISEATLTTEYRYRHGYWDGAEREFRGFAMVEQVDTETFTDAGAHYSPPLLTRTWFHVGPVASREADDWAELELRHEYWPGDEPVLTRPPEMTGFLAGLPRRARRDALRALRGRVLRTELYALDGTDRQDRPYTVTESLSGVRAESDRVYLAFDLAQRTTQWERGADPMTRFAFTSGYDAYGLPTQHVAIAVPRGRDHRVADPAAAQPYLATYTTTEYARRDDDSHYMVDRVARTTTSEIHNDGHQPVFALRDEVLAGTAALRVIGQSRTCYDGEAYLGLPVGRLGDHGIAVRTESLAFTDEFLDELYDPAAGPRPAYLDPLATNWPDEYPQEFRTLLPGLAGHVHHRADETPGSPGGYYVVTRHRYDVHDPARRPRGLLLSTVDPLGAPSRIEYDEHDLLPTRTTDAAGLSTQTRYDKRLLVPVEVVDVNGNSQTVTYSPAGMVTAGFVRGRDGTGDAIRAGTEYRYDLHAFAERGQPVSVRSARRVHHDTAQDVPAGERDEVVVTVDYTDGFGRLLQTRTQAEDTLFGDPVFGGGVLPADQGEPGGAAVGRARRPGEPDNVVVSGWQVYDNKGRIVQKYEPFLATGFDVAPPLDAQLGRKTTMSYDPRGNVLRAVHPDGSQRVVVPGVPVELGDPDVFAPTPWESFTYDANDNAGRTHGDAAAAYRGHWDTPASIEIDALGRIVVECARNGRDPGDWFVTRFAHDIQGNLVTVTDPLGRTAFRYRFDLAGRGWRTENIDAGRRDTVPDSLGNVVESRDGKGALTLCARDALHRPVRLWARDGTGGQVTLRQRTEYGDAGDPGQPAGEREAARAHNLLGRAVAHYDEAGLVTVSDVDFKGNVLDSARRVIADEPIIAGYARAAAEHWAVTPFQVDWQPGAGETFDDRAAELLEADAYRMTTSFDALNRITRHVLPSDVDGRRQVLRPAYNRAGALERVSLDDTVYVERIAYDATGRRTLIAYGNGVLTRYAYDPRTFRLARLRSEHYTTDGLTYQPTGPAIQDHSYRYDLAGNILSIHDRTPGSGIPGNPMAFAAPTPAAGAPFSSGDALDRQFTYDPLYRLLRATGREYDLPPDSPPWLDAPRGTDVTRVRAYTETYTYDPVGSLLRLAHDNRPGGFTRDFAQVGGTNRLARMTVGTTPYEYRHDPNGNVVAETTSRRFDWNHADQLTGFATQVDGAEPSVHAHYLYDAAGERIKKVVRRQGGAVEVTLRVGAFEHHRWSGGSAGANNHLHVMDGATRIALVRVGPPAPGDGGPATEYHLADHVGSSTVVLDGDGRVTNREEFTPYGETSFGTFARKRFRFTGKERDEESGLLHLGARYLWCWTGRFGSVDPHQGRYPAASPYCYASGNPVGTVDPTGMDPVRTAEANVDNISQNVVAEAKAAATNLKGAEMALHEADVEFGKLAMPKDYRELVTSGDFMKALGQKTKNMLRNEVSNAEEVIAAANKVHDALVGRDNALKLAKGALGKLKGALNYLDGVAKRAFEKLHPDAPANKSLADTRLTVDKTINEMKQMSRGLQDVKAKGYKPVKPPPPPGGGGGGGPRRTSITSEPLSLGEIAGWVLIGIDLLATSAAIISADSLGEQATEVAKAGGRWGGMAYGVVACAEFGPWAMAGCGFFGAVFGENAVKGLAQLIPAGLQAREEAFQKIMKMPPKERDAMLRYTCLSGGPSCHQ